MVTWKSPVTIHAILLADGVGVQWRAVWRGPYTQTIYTGHKPTV